MNQEPWLPVGSIGNQSGITVAMMVPCTPIQRPRMDIKWVVMGRGWNDNCFINSYRIPQPGIQAGGFCHYRL
nr:MAG TPA: hypothetical protein [Caudoviricetes sp.]